MLQSLEYSRYIFTEPTNFDQTPSLIDLILTNKLEKCSRFGQISSDLSNHDILFACFSEPNLRFEEKPRLWRNFKSVDECRLFSDARDCRLEDVFYCTDANVMTDLFSSKMSYLLNKHAPLIPFYPKPDLTSTAPWYTADIDRASIDAELARKLFRSNKTADNRRQYHKMRNKVNDLIRQAKRSYFGPKLHPTVGSRKL